MKIVELEDNHPQIFVMVLENMKLLNRNIDYRKIANLDLGQIFDWGSTPQGNDFWARVYDRDFNSDKVKNIISSYKPGWETLKAQGAVEFPLIEANIKTEKMNIMGSKKAVTCENVKQAQAVEKWRISQGFDPTPEGYILSFDLDGQDGKHLMLSKAWGVAPSLTDMQPEEIMTFEQFNKRLAGIPDFEAITTSIKSLLEYKNKKYGNSALEPMQVFSGKTKLGTRLDDKLARIKNGTELKKNDVADCIGYLMLICAENGWDNFDEVKD